MTVTTVLCRLRIATTLVIGLLLFNFLAGCDEDEPTDDTPTEPVETSAWKSVEPVVESNQFRSGMFIDDRGWLVGTDGAIIFTKDGGDTWQELASGTNRTFWDVEFFDKDTGWVAGREGKVLRTEDGGQTWRDVLIQFTDRTMYALEPVNANKLFTVGDRGYLHYSVDGGRRFHSDSVNARMDFRDFVVHDTTALAVGLNGAIVRFHNYSRIITTGSTEDTVWADWTEVIAPVEADFWGATHTRTGDLFVVGSGGAILKSTDLGVSWEAVASGVTDDLLDIKFISDTEALIAGRNGTILFSTDGGGTWQAAEKATAQDLYAVWWTEDAIWAMGSLALLKSPSFDAFNWTLTPTGTTQLTTLTDIAFADADRGVVVGYGNTVMRTSDGGDSWTLIRRGSLFDPNEWHSKIQFVDDQHGFIVGRTGLPPYHLIVMSTADTGTTWQTFTHPEIPWAIDAAFVSASTGYVAGGETVYKTTDSGQSWVEKPLPIPNDFFGIDFISESTGWVVGSGGFIFRTNTGGDVWARVNPDTVTARFYAVDFLDDGYGFAVGGLGNIWRTLDSGATWERQEMPTQEDLVDIEVLDHGTAYAVGGNGTILFTVDGGATWTLQPVLTTRSLIGINFLNADTGWAVGAEATLLRTTTGGL